MKKTLLLIITSALMSSNLYPQDNNDLAAAAIIGLAASAAAIEQHKENLETFAIFTTSFKFSSLEIIKTKTSLGSIVSNKEDFVVRASRRKDHFLIRIKHEILMVLIRT